MSLPVSVKELIALAVGLVLMLAVNAVLLRASLRPLDGLTDLMKRVDLLRPGERAGLPATTTSRTRSFNEMLDRLEAEGAPAPAGRWPPRRASGSASRRSCTTRSGRA